MILIQNNVLHAFETHLHTTDRRRKSNTHWCWFKPICWGQGMLSSFKKSCCSAWYESISFLSVSTNILELIYTLYKPVPDIFFYYRNKVYDSLYWILWKCEGHFACFEWLVIGQEEYFDVGISQQCFNATPVYKGPNKVHSLYGHTIERLKVGKICDPMKSKKFVKCQKCGMNSIHFTETLILTYYRNSQRSDKFRNLKHYNHVDNTTIDFTVSITWSLTQNFITKKKNWNFFSSNKPPHMRIFFHSKERI